MTTAHEANFDEDNTYPQFWLTPENTSTVQNLEADEQAWIIANIQGTNYYRVNYDDRNWDLLRKQLLDNHKVIHVINRAHLIDDAFALSGIKKLPYTTALGLIEYLSQEMHSVPWDSALRSLSYIGSMFSSTPHLGQYKVIINIQYFNLT